MKILLSLLFLLSSTTAFSQSEDFWSSPEAKKRGMGEYRRHVCPKGMCKDPITGYEIQKIKKSPERIEDKKLLEELKKIEIETES